MGLNNKIRRSYSVILDSINELNIIFTDKEKIKSNKETKSHFEREVEKIGEAIKRIGKKNPLLKIFKDIRNKIAHQFDVKADDIIPDISKNLEPLKEYVEEFIEKNFSSNPKLKNFEKFGNIGNQKDRSKLIDALVDKLTEKDRNLRTKFPSEPSIQKYSSAVDKITEHPNLLKLSGDNSIIALQITEDITEWAKNTKKQIEIHDPFLEEQNLLTESKALSIQDFYKSYEEITSKLKEIYHNKEINFSFFDKKIKYLDKKLDIERNIKREIKNASKRKANLEKGIEHFINSPEFKKFEKNLPFNKESFNSYIENKTKQIYDEADILRNNFIKDWKIQLLRKKQKYELEQIEKAREEFIKELYRKIKDFYSLKELLEPFTNDLGRLWNLSGGVWNNSGFEILKHYADILENDKSIKDLAKMLGRYRKAEKEFEEIEIEKVIIKPKFKPRHANKGEVIGIKESNDISSILPVEVATLANPNTKSIFVKKYAEKKLLTYDFQNQFASTEIIGKKEKQLKEKEDGKGPIIICVDTSGSMKGTPEQIAKTICFALTKIALSEKRECYLISFSTGIQTLELTDLDHSLNSLVKFLNMSFDGGTDSMLALEEALRMLETENYKKADVLMISDFVMSGLSEQIIERIENKKEDKVKFHSLVIGKSENQKVVKVFDNNWIYDLKNQKSIITLVKNLNEAKF